MTRALAAGLVLALAAGPARAESLFDHMKRLCIDTGAEPAAAIAAADAARWAAPAKARKSRGKKLERVMQTPRGDLILAAETATSRGTTNHSCSLTAGFIDPNLRQEAGAWAEVPAEVGKDGLYMFGFLDRGGKHLATDQVGQCSSVTELMASMRMLGLAERSGATFISYTLPAKSPN